MGPPERLLSDRGGEFVNEVLASLAAEAGVKRLMTTAYHPEGNGAAERQVQTASRAVARMMGDGYEWTSVLPIVAAALNASPCRSTTFAPYTLWFGRPPRSMQALWSAEPPELAPPIPQFAQQLVEAQLAAVRAATEEIERTQREMGAYYDAQVPPGPREDLPVGIFVWRFTPRYDLEAATLRTHNPWGLVPWLVVARPTPATATIQDARGERSVVNIAMLRPVRSPVPGNGEVGRAAVTELIEEVIGARKFGPNAIPMYEVRMRRLDGEHTNWLLAERVPPYLVPAHFKALAGLA